MRFVKNKKGGMVFPVLADIVGLFLMILLILVFLIITKWTTTPFTFSIEAKPLENYETQVQFYSILNTPVEYDGVTLEMQELIGLMFTAEEDDKKQYEAILRPKLESILNKLEYCHDELRISGDTLTFIRGYRILISEDSLKDKLSISSFASNNFAETLDRIHSKINIQLPPGKDLYILLVGSSHNIKGFTTIKCP
tara:strand:+ start:567 stop:1154 length:588 start_codon:yes stop_codon:yes gene_type:complete